MHRNTETGDLRELDGSLVAMWAETGNPKGALWVPVPSRPSPHHTWDGAQWVGPDPAVEEAKRAAAIKAERDNRILTGGYRVGSNWYHSDLVSRSQQIGLVIMGANIPAGLKWKAMGGAVVDMTQTLAMQIFAAAAASDSALHAVAEAAIANGTAPDAVQWPARFGGA